MEIIRRVREEKEEGNIQKSKGGREEKEEIIERKGET